MQQEAAIINDDEEGKETNVAKKKWLQNQPGKVLGSHSVGSVASSEVIKETRP